MLSGRKKLNFINEINEIKELSHCWYHGFTLNRTNIDDYIDLGDRLNDVNVPFSIAAWIWVNDTYFVIFSQDDNSTDSGNYHGFWFQVLDDSQHLAIALGDGRSSGPSGRRSKDRDLRIPHNTWTHVAAVVRGQTDMSLFVNGQEVQGSYSGTGREMVHNSWPAIVGKGTRWGPRVSNGIIDDVYIYNRALTETEIKALFDNGG